MEHAQTNQASRSHRIAYNASAHCMLPSIHARQQQAVQSRSREQGRGRKHNVLSALSFLQSAARSAARASRLSCQRHARQGTHGQAAENDRGRGCRCSTGDDDMEGGKARHPPLGSCAPALASMHVARTTPLERRREAASAVWADGHHDDGWRPACARWSSFCRAMAPIFLLIFFTIWAVRVVCWIALLFPQESRAPFFSGFHLRNKVRQEGTGIYIFFFPPTPQPLHDASSVCVSHRSNCHIAALARGAGRVSKLKSIYSRPVCTNNSVPELTYVCKTAVLSYDPTNDASTHVRM
jgi:hypothetical protein